MRNFSLYWRKKMVDWLTISWLPTQTMGDLRELRRIVEIMDSASRTIFQEKKAALELPSPTLLQPIEASAGARGKDIMSIMRAYLLVHTVSFLTCDMRSKSKYLIFRGR